MERSLNWKELNLILEELNLAKSKIQNCVQATTSTLILELYNQNERSLILMCTAPHFVRIHQIQKKPKKPPKAQRFQQLLQARLTGGIIQSVTQPHNERVIYFTITKDNVSYALYVKLWNNNANIILCDENNTIIDVMFRRPSQRLMPRQQFTVPSPSQKKSTTVREWNSRVHSQFNHYIAHYYELKELSEHNSLIKKKLLKTETQKYMQVIKHIVAIEEQEKTLQTPEYYTHYADTLLSNPQDIDISPNTLLANSNMSSQNPSYNVLQALPFAIPAKIPNKNKIPDKTSRTASKQPSHKQIVEIAQMFYQRAKQVKTLQRELLERKAILEDKQKRLKHTLDMLEQIDPNNLSASPILERIGYSDIQSDATLAHQPPFPRTKHKQASRPGIWCKIDNWIVALGRNTKENDILLRSYFNGNDYWMHVNGKPGCYLFIKFQKNKKMPEQLKINCAQLVALFSKVGDYVFTQLYFTQVKYLKRIKKKPGLVSVQKSDYFEIESDYAHAKKLLHTHKIETDLSQ